MHKYCIMQDQKVFGVEMLPARAACEDLKGDVTIDYLQMCCKDDPGMRKSPALFFTLHSWELKIQQLLLTPKQND